LFAGFTIVGSEKLFKNFFAVGFANANATIAYPELYTVLVRSGRNTDVTRLGVLNGICNKVL
jgi:hypothetical protein